MKLAFLSLTTVTGLAVLTIVYSGNQPTRRTPAGADVLARIEGQSAVIIDGVEVTDTSFDEIARNLAIREELLDEIRKRGGQILTVGEGISDLLPALLERGLSAQGLDLWYHSANLRKEASFGSVAGYMAWYQEQYGEHLIRGDATSMPVPAESIDLVLSHLLINNLHIADQLRVIAESVRVLRSRGEARLLLSRSRNEHISEKHRRVILDFLSDNFSDTVRVRIDGGLLTIEKLRTNLGQFSPAIPFDPERKYSDLPIGAKRTRTEMDHRASEYPNDPGVILLERLFPEQKGREVLLQPKPHAPKPRPMQHP